jgi:hypothetical protein
MQKLFAVPWLSSSGRAVLSILCVAILVGGVLAILKTRSGGKHSPAEELVTGSIQNVPVVRQSQSSDAMAAFLIASAEAQSIKRSIKSTMGDLSSIPLPRPRPKRP